MSKWFKDLNDKFKDDPEYLQERIEDLYDEIRSLQDRLAEVEKERDEYKQRWRDAIDELIRVGNERDKWQQDSHTNLSKFENLHVDYEKLTSRLAAVERERDEYKDEYVTLAAAYWELRRVVKWYLDMLDAQFNPKDLDSVRMTKDGIDEFNKIVVNSEAALREAAKEG